MYADDDDDSDISKVHLYDSNLENNGDDFDDNSTPLPLIELNMQVFFLCVGLHTFVFLHDFIFLPFHQ